MAKTVLNFTCPQICFWLVENGFSVLIAACDTFRAGAVEQLRTHSRHLNALHPPEEDGGRPLVQLYEKGYGKDAAGIAMEAIKYGTYWVWCTIPVKIVGTLLGLSLKSPPLPLDQC